MLNDASSYTSEAFIKPMALSKRVLYLPVERKDLKHSEAKMEIIETLPSWEVVDAFLQLTSLIVYFWPLNVLKH